MNRALILAFFLSIISCEKNQKVVNITTKEIIIEAEYINYAWGYQHSSLLVDTNGIAYRYDNMDYSNTAWKFPDSLGFISANDLQNNYNLANTPIDTINKDTITQIASLITNVSINNLSDITYRGDDMGTSRYYAYIWNEDVNKYQKLFLAQCGDMRQVNNDTNAQKILALITRNNYCP